MCTTHVIRMAPSSLRTSVIDIVMILIRVMSCIIMAALLMSTNVIPSTMRRCVNRASIVSTSLAMFSRLAHQIVDCVVPSTRVVALCAYNAWTSDSQYQYNC